jgi:hypothetical protein
MSIYATILEIVSALRVCIANAPAVRHFDLLKCIQGGILPWIEDRSCVVENDDYNNIVRPPRSRSLVYLLM